MIFKKYCIPLIWLCEILFILRVLGQAYVAIYAPEWLPPMSEWYSGLIPYFILFPIQVLLIVLMTKISYDQTKQTGCFFITSRKKKIILRTISAVYFLIMAGRYLLIMALFPERRWFTGVIPILFHWVLASYIYLLTLNKDES